MLNTAASYTKYKETQIMTASPGELIIMLYDGAIKFATQAKTYIIKRNIEKANADLLRTQDIITELMSSLNMDTGDIAKNLYNLYDYMIKRLVEANIAKNPRIVEEVIGLLCTLRSAWVEINRKTSTA